MYVNTDILNIISINEYKVEITNIYNEIYELSNGTNQNIINEYLKQYFNNTKVKNITVESIKFNNILKKFNYGNVNIYNILKNYIDNTYITVNETMDYSKLITKLDFQGQNIIILQDLNILYTFFNFNSFNFDINIIKIINDYNNFKDNIFNYYYNTKNIEFYKELINYNYIDFKYIYENYNLFE
jgi:hypothetical protein